MAGSYTGLDFEVENLEVEEENDQPKREQVLELLASIRQVYQDVPERASMVVEREFEGGPFCVYFDAEIEVEMGLTPALTTSDVGGTRSLSVDAHPALWFRRAAGTVMDLSQFELRGDGRAHRV